MHGEPEWPRLPAEEAQKEVRGCPKAWLLHGFGLVYICRPYSHRPLHVVYIGLTALVASVTDQLVQLAGFASVKKSLAIRAVRTGREGYSGLE